MESWKLLLLSPLTQYSGNYSYISRLRCHLEKSGITCYLADPADFCSCAELTDYIHEHCVSLLIGIHAYKAGKVLSVLGGTDINECTRLADRMTIMTTAITNASHVVGFNQPMLDKFFTHWPNYDLDKTSTISQAVQVFPSTFSIQSYIKNNILLPWHELKKTSNGQEDLSHGVNDDLQLFTMVGGIRPVKNPLYLVKGFSEWRMQKNLNCYFVMIGPQMDEEYFLRFQNEISGLPGVLYIPGLSMDDTHAAVRDSFAFVNSSESEGMSLAILEAMCLQTPVLARDIPGNRDIVKDGQTGFLFTTVQDFLQKAELLLDKPEIVKKHKHNASVYVSQQHSLSVEEKKYMLIIKRLLELP